MAIKAPKTKAEKLAFEKERMALCLKILKQTYPDATCALTYSNAFELLVATVLSAQCTDKRVNMVTPALFETYGTPEKLAKASLPKVESLIRSTGFFKNKAKALVELSKDIVSHHQGQVPQTLDQLTKLRGVGRKTANVVLGNAFGIAGLVVDTHVGRLCRRLGFTKQQDPEKVESEMMVLVPKEEWTLFSHLLISHGRAICDARKPKCVECQLKEICPRLI